jgi:hypothetical protein
MSDERWTIMIGLMFSPAGWIAMSVAVAAVGFLLELTVDLVKKKRTKDG